MTARGLRNNNGGNLRTGSPWRGLAEPHEMTDEQLAEDEFCVFIAPIYGIRALCKLLINYNTRHGLNTIRGIISRYAPASENDLEAYIHHIAVAVGYGADHELNIYSHAVMRRLVVAIITHENGACPYSHEIDDGMLLAGIRNGT